MVFEEGNRFYLKEFMKDVCGIMEIGKLIEREDLPEFFTFHITSLGEIEPLLNQKERNIIVDIMTKAIQNFRESLKTTFADSEIAGQILFLPFLSQQDGIQSVIEAESQLDFKVNQLLSEKRLLSTSVNYLILPLFLFSLFLGRST